MQNITDPALEFVEICDALRTQSNDRGSAHIAKAFRVDQWSSEFYEILFCIINRAYFICDIIKSNPNNAYIEADVRQSINTILVALQPESLMTPWNNKGITYLDSRYIQQIKFISPTIRQSHSYPKISEQESKEILDLVNTLVDWLSEAQLTENDFIRQAMIEGLQRFSFRLDRIKWLGWGYTTTSLRDVIGAYLALERQTPLDKSDPQAEAILKKVGSAIFNIYEKVGVLKEGLDRGEAIIKIYGLVSIATAATPIIAGFLKGP